MEKTVTFRDYQKAQTEDFNNLQIYAQQSFDDLVGDAVTGSLRYAGFNVVKSNTAEITVAPGRFYGANSSGAIGAVFTLPTQSIMSLVQYLAVSQVTQKYLTLVTYGVVDAIDIQTRDYLTNTQTLQTQPQAVSMTTSRDAVLGIVSGAESGTPIAPVTGVGQVAIANILVDSNGIVSITQLTTALVSSTEGLNTRLTVVETFDTQVGPRITTLATDLAALSNEIDGIRGPDQTLLLELISDVANLKALANLPNTYAEYGAMNFAFMDTTLYDTGNTQALGFNALIYFGCRFPAQNASEAALSLFNTLDPNASIHNGLLIPTYTDNLVLQTGGWYGPSVSMSQYGYVTYSVVEQNIGYGRIVTGPSYVVCGYNTPNLSGNQPGDGTSNIGWWLPNFSTYQNITETSTYQIPGKNESWQATFDQYYWREWWSESYWSLDTSTHTVNGAQIAQTFLVSSDMWITKIAVWMVSVASPNADIWVTVCGCTNGQPDLTQTIAHVVMPAASLAFGFNYAQIPPAFCQRGDRMAVVFTTAANHQIGITPAGGYIDGTFFYTLDGAYFLGDLTVELYLEIYAAQFNANQVTIEFGALNLSGGIRNFDLTARTIIPDSCQLIYEVLPAGTANWLPLGSATPLVPFATAPVLARFRARFVGTSAVMPGIVLNDSICNIWSPGTVFTLVTIPQTLAAASATITLKLIVENFNPTAHSLTSIQGNGAGFIKIYHGTGPAVAINPASVVTSLMDATIGQYSVLATFSGISPTISAFTAVINGTTNSASNVFHIANLTWWAL